VRVLITAGAHAVIEVGRGQREAEAVATEAEDVEQADGIDAAGQGDENVRAGWQQAGPLEPAAHAGIESGG